MEREIRAVHLTLERLGECRQETRLYGGEDLDFLPDDDR